MAKVRSNISHRDPSKHTKKKMPFMEETCIQCRRLKCIPRNTELRGKFRHAIIMRNQKSYRNT